MEKQSGIVNVNVNVHVGVREEIMRVDGMNISVIVNVTVMLVNKWREP